MSQLRCVVCGDEDHSALLMDCERCGGTFHVNPYANRPGRDCGLAMLGPAMVVVAYCDPCVALMRDAQPVASSRAEGAKGIDA